jgi:Rrf2 family iron-sulfur cluster assembly transcriptional regulator
MFSKLRQHGLVESTRGPGGGYGLGHRADSITVADIIVAVEGCADRRSLNTTHQGESMAQGVTQDATQGLWDALNSKMVDYLQSITLRSLAAAQRANGVQAAERKPARQGVFKQSKSEPVWAKGPNSVFALGQSLLARS